MQFSPSPSPAPAITRQKSEPDLFFPSSDSEEDRDDIKPSTEAEHRLPSPFLSKVPKSSAPISRSRTPLFEEIESNGHGHERGHKSMKSQDSDIVPIEQPPSSTSVAGPSRSLKRPSPPSRVSSFQVPDSFSGGYLGEFVCEGWSLSKGKGYCTPGSKIVFERPKAAKTATNDVKPAAKGEKMGPGKLVGGKMVNNPKGKQMTLGAMMAKKATPPPTKKPGAKSTVDSIIRFRNDRGFEVGRLSVTEASFLVHLLDTDIISLTGHVIDCPPSLSTGVTILLNVKVFLTRKAFEKPDKTAREENGTFWQEQKETADEEAMRQRKEALGFLFGESPV